jgi:hypothetical protein
LLAAFKRWLPLTCAELVEAIIANAAAKANLIPSLPS